jgi:hypothetical protein
MKRKTDTGSVHNFQKQTMLNQTEGKYGTTLLIGVLIIAVSFIVVIKWMELKESVLALEDHNDCLTRNYSFVLLCVTA